MPPQAKLAKPQPQDAQHLEQRLTADQERTDSDVAALDVAKDRTSEVIHELGQPLTAIHCFSTVALNQIDDSRNPDYPALKEVLEQVVNASNLAIGIIDRYRAKSATRQRYDIRQLVREVVELLRYPLQEKGMILSIRASTTGDAAFADIDPVQIQEVLINLVRNASEANKEPSGCIEIAVESKPDEVIVSVVDEGPGVSPRLRDSLFSPVPSAKERGMGIGLAVSKSIIDAHGGRIWYQDNHPAGAQFLFGLAAAKGQAELPGASSDNRSRPPEANNP